MASLTAREKSRHSLTVRLCLRGTTTCTPRPPVVLTQDRRFSVFRTSRTSAAAFTTCVHDTRGTGSRSHTRACQRVAPGRGGRPGRLPARQRPRTRTPLEPVRTVDVGGGRIPGVDL